MVTCAFQYAGGISTCTHCGFSMPQGGKIVRRCDVQSRPGLGDIVAAGLSAIGITKERVSALAGGDCGCSKRQEQLNELGRRVGIG
jgi:hypothetical protein